MRPALLLPAEVQEMQQRILAALGHVGVVLQVVAGVEPVAHRQALEAAPQAVVQQPVDARVAAAGQLPGVVARVEQGHRHQRLRVAMPHIVAQGREATACGSRHLVVVQGLVEPAQGQRQCHFHPFCRARQRRPRAQGQQPAQGLCRVVRVFQPAAQPAAWPQLHGLAAAGRQRGHGAWRPAQEGQHARAGGQRAQSGHQAVVQPVQCLGVHQVLHGQQCLVLALGGIGQGQCVVQALGQLAAQQRLGFAAGDAAHQHLQAHAVGVARLLPDAARHLQLEADHLVFQQQGLGHVVARNTAQRGRQRLAAAAQQHRRALGRRVARPAAQHQATPALHIGAYQAAGPGRGAAQHRRRLALPGFHQVRLQPLGIAIALGRRRGQRHLLQPVVQIGFGRPQGGVGQGLAIDQHLQGLRGARQGLPDGQGQLDLKAQRQCLHLEAAPHVLARHPVDGGVDAGAAAAQADVLGARLGRVQRPADQAGALDALQRHLGRRRIGCDVGRTNHGLGHRQHSKSRKGGFSVISLVAQRTMRPSPSPKPLH